MIRIQTIIGSLLVTLMVMGSYSLCFAKHEGVGGVKGIEERLSELESFWDGLKFSGTVEIQADYKRLNSDDSAPEQDMSNVSVANVELAIDAGITDNIKSHVLLRYEEGAEDNHVGVDEAIIHIRADGVCVPDKAHSSGWYASIGQMYVPFGYFDSHFINDPITLVLGETRASAALMGYAAHNINLSAGAFNGAIPKTDETDDRIDNVVASLRVTLPDGVVPGVGVLAGVSYITDIAESAELQGHVVSSGGTTVSDFVAGFGSFLSVSVMDGKLLLTAEYIEALDDFVDGDLDFATGDLTPKAWNFELSFLPDEKLQFGAKYEGSDDLGTFAPESQLGVHAKYKLAESTVLAVEYLRGIFENDDTRDLASAQVAIAF